MGVTGKKRHRHSANVEACPPQEIESVEITPEQMFENEDYEGVIRTLRPVITPDSPDDQIRLFIRASMSRELIMDDTEVDQVLGLAEGIREKDEWEYRIIGWCCIQEENWDSAVEALEKSISIKETAHSYYLLSIALSTGKENHHLDEEKQKPAVINALQNASRFEDCPPDVFFRLENFEYYTPDGVKKRIEILSRCLQLYPGHARTSVLLSGWKKAIFKKPIKSFQAFF